MSNVIVFDPGAAQASVIAWRRLPAPLSALVTTTGFGMHALTTCSTVLLVLGSWCVPPR